MRRGGLELTNCIYYARLPAISMVVPIQLVYDTQALQEENEAPDAERPPACGNTRSTSQRIHMRLRHCLSQPFGSSGKRDDSFIVLPHPAGVRGVEKRREISALVGPNSPV